ncbi:DUF5681 domain-containing protein [Geminicoccus flavidas]|uniref:DUF5681 domain-containing protein n=1 Tax=Geminicoccus flavidas TaxID=2506407 RepID=UPI001F226A96|nr:DUF5681 domain-containing protein [Geminicoccus flavidas]
MQGRGRFQKGRSGNPAGKRRGSRNRATVLLDKIATEQAEAILRAAIDAALSGDSRAQKALLDRIWPIKRSRPIEIDLPSIRTAADATNGIETVIAYVADGRLTVDEGAALAALLETRIRHHAIDEVEARLARLEQEMAKHAP